MKKYFGILLLLMVSVSIFGQTQKEYTQYSQLQIKVGKTPVSYDKWAKWYKTEFPTPSPGDYLIKSQNQILSGVGCDIVGGIVVYASSKSYTNHLLNNNWKYISTSQQGIEERANIKTNRDIGYVIGGLLGIVGFGLEISGILNMGEAGISLNSNGVGVKVKF
jgi:hypothetical protein